MIQQVRIAEGDFCCEGRPCRFVIGESVIQARVVHVDRKDPYYKVSAIEIGQSNSVNTMWNIVFTPLFLQTGVGGNNNETIEQLRAEIDNLRAQAASDCRN